MKKKAKTDTDAVDVREYKLSLYGGWHSVTFLKFTVPTVNWAIKSTLKPDVQGPAGERTTRYLSMIDGIETLLLSQVQLGMILGRPGAARAIEDAVDRLRDECSLPLLTLTLTLP